MARVDAKGPDLEARVARLHFAEGSFARRRVNLEASFGGHFPITDIDVMTFEFSPTLDLRIRVGECKATEAKGSPSAGDRLLWLAGLVHLVGAHGGFLATSRAAGPRERELAARLGLEVDDDRDLARREAISGLEAAGGYGPHDMVIRAIETRAFTATKRDEALRRVYWFVRSELWLSAPVAALKKAMGGLRLVGSKWSERLPSDEKEALRWLAAELTVGFCLAVVRLAGEAYRQPEDAFAVDLEHRLAEGVATFDAMREISRSVDRMFIGAIRELGVDPSRAVKYLGAFEPQPPGYTEPLAEVIQRLATSPRAAAEVPRAADALFAESFGAGRPGGSVDPLSTETYRLLRIVGTFLERQTRVPEPLVAVLLGTNGNGHGSAASPPAAKELTVDTPTLFGAAPEPDTAPPEAEVAGDSAEEAAVEASQESSQIEPMSPKVG